MWGNPLNTTPYFNELCRQGIFFDRCFTPGYGTSRGVWATITGIPDVEYTNTSSRNPASVDQNSIINDYKGYEKFYFIGGNSGFENLVALFNNNIDGIKIYEDSPLPNTFNNAEVIIAKGRNIGLARMWFNFNPELTYFSNCEYESNDQS